MNLEMERRYLIELPLSEEAALLLHEEMSAEIKQVYLLNDDGLTERARSIAVKLGQITCNHYYQTFKKFVAVGVNEEEEDAIQEEQHAGLMNRADPNRYPIEKTRYFFCWEDQDFELDLFHGRLEGLAILEIELEDIEEEVDLPEFLVVVREITAETEYGNYQLSTLKDAAALVYRV